MSLDLFSLEGKTALLTGSSGGIGLRLAQGLAAAGAVIILNGRNRIKLEAAARQLSGAGYQTHQLPMDVCNEMEVAEGLAAIMQDVGPA
jgi:gluconate 5-dehydrogenase